MKAAAMHTTIKQLDLPLGRPGRHRTHEMRSPSLEAGAVKREELGKRALSVLAWLKDNGPATARQVMEGMAFKDMNCVRPRLTELRKAGLIYEKERIPDHLTGINVYPYAVCPPQP